MRSCSLWLGLLLTLIATGAAPAHYCENGQQPVHPAIAARMALPACGFAATKFWGPNGCQLCDPRNMYPNPFAVRDTPRHRYHDSR
jgi:hypothetical protein